MLQIKEISKTFANGTLALQDVSFEVAPGEFVAILGKSGSGKSTLLRTVNRLVEPDTGVIEFDGQTVTRVNTGALRNIRRQIAMVFQNFNLVDRLSVMTNVLTGRLGYTPSSNALLNRFTSEEIDVASSHLVRLGLGDKMYQRADRLSGGQRQRVGIARALMQEPKLLLADEPVSSLDPVAARGIMKMLQKINEQGVTVLCNLHVPELAKEFGNRLLCLKQGRIVFDGQPDALPLHELEALYAPDAED